MDDGIDAFNKAPERRGRPKVRAEDPSVFNAWDFEDDPSAAEYSPFKLYTRATNKHDHSEKVQATFMPRMYGMMMELVQSDEIPGYRSVQDFIRDATYHRVHFWSEKIGDPVLRARFQSELAVQRAQAETDRRAAELADMVKLLDSAREVLQGMRTNGDVFGEAEAVEYYEGVVDTLREPYASRLMMTLRMHGSEIR